MAEELVDEELEEESKAPGESRQGPEDDSGEPADNPEPLPEATAEGEQELAGVELVKKEAIQETLPEQQKKVDVLRVIEAALFIGNKPLAYPELALLAKTSVRKAKELAEKLQKEYDSKGGAIEVVLNAQEAVMQVRPDFLGNVAELSKEVDLSRKATKMLSLIAKKGKMLQSELKRYFRGEIYAYVSELKERGYVTSEKAGATRLLRPTEKFRETFQMAAA